MKDRTISPLIEGQQDLYRMERGSGVVTAAGVLFLMVLFCGFAINAARYYAFRSRVQALALQVSSYAGTFLPDIKEACKHGWTSYNGLNDDLGTAATDAYIGGATLTLTVDHATGSSSCAADGTLTPKAILPIKGIKAKISADMNLLTDSGLLHWSILNNGLTTLTVVSEATAQLTPTDVVMVIENSNSTVTPVSGVPANPSQFSDIWGGYGVGAYSASAGNKWLAKSEAYTRQCFGDVTNKIKTAAIKMYDLLTSNESYRVGVIHTTQGGGEHALGTIRITPDSYTLPYTAQAGSATPPYDTEYLDWPQGNSSFGAADYPESRCATLARSGIAPIPAHPLIVTNQVEAAAGVPRTALNTLLTSAGEPQTAGNPSDLGHLSWVAGTTLLPRELIWIKNSGVTTAAGDPNPKYDLVNFQFPILRAMDMLRLAPARTDKKRVRRKVVLVFNDGFEKPYTDGVVPMMFNGNITTSDNRADDRTFTRYTEVVLSGSGDPTSQQVDRLPSATGTPAVLEEYCNDDAYGHGNLIYDTTQVDGGSFQNNLHGIKLGFLYYPYRPADLPDDPMNRLRSLPGHPLPTPIPGLTGDAVSPFDNQCNTQWSTLRGRFVLVDGTASGLSSSVVPLVGRSLFISEIVNWR